LSGAQVIIRPLVAQDIPRVVELFYEQFPNLSWTRLGKNFIRKSICWHFVFHPELALVTEADNQVIGFIVGATGGHRQYYRQVLRYAFPEFLLGLLLHPWLLFKRGNLTQWVNLIRSPGATETFRQNTAMSKSGEKKAIICFVAVMDAAQGRGIGTSLKQAFEEAAFQTGIEVLSSYTEINNYAARRLNEKRGWKQVREDPHHKTVYFSKRVDKLPRCAAPTTQNGFITKKSS
jgi:ribosomal protein S18 acetylase RimI-like enzyme